MCDALADSPVPGLLDVIPAYATLTLLFDPRALDPDGLRRELNARFAHVTLGGEKPATTIEIPVCYDDEFAPDLADVAAHTGLTRDEVVRVHASASYEVAFVGFSPGFGYLSGLPTQLATPRLDSPRVRIEPGSVGIAGDQTGVYPHATPGGWRIIGRTPVRMFDEARAPASLLTIGDHVRFVPIERDEFEAGR